MEIWTEYIEKLNETTGLLDEAGELASAAKEYSEVTLQQCRRMGKSLKKVAKSFKHLRKEIVNC